MNLSPHTRKYIILLLCLYVILFVLLRLFFVILIDSNTYLQMRAMNDMNVMFYIQLATWPKSQGDRDGVDVSHPCLNMGDDMPSPHLLS